MRQLATIRQIIEVAPIPGADRIELAMIDGWRVVVGKGEFHAGDKCIYCEVDSLLPIAPDFEFLRKSSYRLFADGTEGFRLKTVKLRGTLSQGLALTMTCLEGRGYPDAGLWPIGTDVTEKLEIRLYEKAVPVLLTGDRLGAFPREIVPKTDEERVQNIPLSVLAKPRMYYVTEKLDGTSFTAYYYKDHFGVCSRNYELKEDDRNVYWKIARLHKLPERLRGFDLAIQGEICGPGIQGNPYRLKSPTLYVFAMYDIARGKYLRFDEVETYCRLWHLPRVPLSPELKATDPITGDPTWVSSAVASFRGYDELLFMADAGSSVGWDDAPREGIVFKSYEPEYFSFKVLSNAYLMSEDDKYDDIADQEEEATLWQRLKNQMSVLFSRIQAGSGA